MSTVSGGGYFGSFLGRVFTRHWLTGGGTTIVEGEQPAEEGRDLRSHRSVVAQRFLDRLAGEPIDRVESVLANGDCPPLQWLRESGNYLTPGGSGSSALAAAVFTRNWLAVLIVLLATVLTVFLSGNFLRAVLNSVDWFHNYELWLQSLAGAHLWWTPWFFVPWLVFALVVVPSGWAYWLTQAGEKRQFATVTIANLLVIGFGLLALRLLPSNSFCRGAAFLGCESLLALLWIWILGMIRCHTQHAKKLLPGKAFVASTLLVSFLPVCWRMSFYLQDYLAHPLLWLSWLAAIILFWTGWRHLRFIWRVEGLGEQNQKARGGLAGWNPRRWGFDHLGIACWFVLVCAVPLWLTFWHAHWTNQKIGKGLMDVWMTAALLSSLYFLAYQVLRKDEQARLRGNGTNDMLLSTWLKSKLSIYMTRGLMAFTILLLLVVINTVGQSLYAMATYAGGTRHLTVALTGLLGLSGLAPLARSLAIRAFGIKEKLRVPLKLLALGGALLLVLLLALAVSIVSQCIAWRLGCPQLLPTRPEAQFSDRYASDIADPYALVEKLRKSADPASKLFRDAIPQAQPLLTTQFSTQNEARGALRDFFNPILTNDILYNVEGLAEACFTAAELDWIDFTRPQAKEWEWLNRRLLQGAYSPEIVEVEEHEPLRKQIQQECGWFHANIFSRLLQWAEGVNARTASRVHYHPAFKTTLPRSPGGKLYQRFTAHRDVGLNDRNLIQVQDAATEIQSAPKQARMSTVDLGLSLAVGLLLTVLFGRTITFLNLSSFHSFYTARLVRAYQGASNSRRWKPDASIRDVEPNDDIAWREYRPHVQGGPLHLINIAINCTRSLETDMESTTAKGLNLCVGPVGLTFGRFHAHEWVRSSHHADAIRDTEVRGGRQSSPKAGEGQSGESRRGGGHPIVSVEPLTLGDWAGISGAAFTTGLGNVGGGGGTAIGTSLLCGLFNVRLGYWWENGFSPSTLASLDCYLPVHQYLLDEFTGSFSLQQRDRWYLSDGGHFENTGAYELIRRQVPFIIIADAGADPNGDLADIANLVRRVRIDFGAEISFMDDDELVARVRADLLAPCVHWRIARKPINRPQEAPVSEVGLTEPAPKAGRLGTLADLHPHFSEDNPLRRVRAHATLAWATYPEDRGKEASRSLLLFIKPGITDDLPADLLNYQITEPDFPHQTTLDQAFDEAQWESYRRLGQYVAGLLFAGIPADPNKWSPAQMRSLNKKETKLP